MEFKLTDHRFINLKSLSLHKANLVGFAVLLSSIIFLCFACEDAERTTQVITSPEEGAQKLPSGEGLDLGALAPDFSLPDSTGNTHNLSQYRGQNLVIVFYRTGT